MSRRPPAVRESSRRDTGTWRVLVYPRGKSQPLDVTMFRGVPTQIDSMSWTDPNGPGSASLSFPAITALEPIGHGDLWWVLPEMDVDIEWIDAATKKVTNVWEGFSISFDWSAGDVGGGLSMDCQGAMLQLDHFLAVPKSPFQPIAYEDAISSQFVGKPSLRLAPLRVELDTSGTLVFDPEKYKRTPLHLVPANMRAGRRWTGFLTRDTGTFSRTLTEYIGGLLSNMHTSAGQYTLRLERGRKPVLKLAKRLSAPDARTLVVSVLQPGVSVSGGLDYSQRANTVYAQGETMRGISFNGMNVSADGLRTWYEPYASVDEVHPTVDNPAFAKGVMRRELMVDFSGGIDEEEAAVVAASQLQRNLDPGFVGTVELKTDPQRSDGTLVPRQTVMPGDTILVIGLLGATDGWMPGGPGSPSHRSGILARITEVTQTVESTSLAIDTKHRDYVTVQEIRTRTRDALAPIRVITPGSFSPTVKDGLFPWSYKLGSGVIPRPPAGASHIFTGMPDSEQFPWEEWVRKHPPYEIRSGKAVKTRWYGHYIRIGPTSSNASLNWATRHSSVNAKDFKAYNVRMSAQGTARQIQVAAFNRYGRPLSVPFHISFWEESGVKPSTMPLLRSRISGLPYLAGQPYPFGPDAFETNKATGQLTPVIPALASATMYAGWGTFAEKAGYSPGSSSNGDMPTGRLETNTSFTWDMLSSTSGNSASRVDVNATPEDNLKNDSKGVADMYVMAYCDAQLNQEVYLLGRILRQEPSGGES